MDDWRELISQKRFVDAEPLVNAEYEAHALLGDEVENSGYFYEAWDVYAQDKDKKNLFIADLSIIIRSTLHGRPAAAKAQREW